MNEEVPVLLVIFNRPDKTRKVFDALRKARPAQLFVAADGSRSEHADDTVKCHLARQIIQVIDWPCDLQTRLLENNMGCDPHIVSAIEWFFEQVAYGIILEDDCCPHLHFFNFCNELFPRYLEDERIMQISGMAPYTPRAHPYDYHFSRAFRCGGGWGTWQRAWNYFSNSWESYPAQELLKMLEAYYPDRGSLILRYKQCLRHKLKDSKQWDILWNMACYAQNGLSIVPEKNLVSNIGFDNEATHTRTHNAVFAMQKVYTLDFPLRHPRFIYADEAPESSLQKHLKKNLRLRSRFFLMLRQVLGWLEYGIRARS